MKTLLVTSRVTFVPENYNRLIAGLADCPAIGGLLTLENREARLLWKLVLLPVAGAPRIGMTLLKNWFGNSQRQRVRAFQAAGKTAWSLPSINAPEAVRLVQEQEFDCVLNARTRHIFRGPILAAPRLGCLNIHHGLLPRQRGTMCDLWALYRGQPSGFTIHEMTAAVDAGPILERVQMTDGSPRDYSACLLASSVQECVSVRNLLERIAQTHRLPAGIPNDPPDGLRHDRNPTGAQLRLMRRAGLRL